MTTQGMSAARSTNGVTSVLDSIWEVVRQSGLEVGDQIPSIRELSDRLHVKQSAVRDAILKAETMGLVKVLPRAGAFLQNSALPIASAPAPHDGSLSGIIQTSLAHDEPNLFYLLDARRVIEVELVGRVAEQRRLEDLVPRTGHDGREHHFRLAWPAAVTANAGLAVPPGEFAQRPAASGPPRRSCPVARRRGRDPGERQRQKACRSPGSTTRRVAGAVSSIRAFAPTPLCRPPNRRGFGRPATTGDELRSGADLAPAVF
ncbi:MAG: FadR family transcriptional regulator [Planctomycetaceae bacterium]|nr:FadR family transcriptional regulator [Planctomycetaceae bacterium]